MSQQAAETDLAFIRDDVLGKLTLIKDRLLAQDPELPTHLAAIHRALQMHEELVHILPDDQIQIYMAGMSKYKQIQIVEEATKARGPRKGKQSADDF